MSSQTHTNRIVAVLLAIALPFASTGVAIAESSVSSVSKPSKSKASSAKAAPQKDGAPAAGEAPPAKEDGETAAAPPKSNRKTAVIWRAILKVVNPTDTRVQIEKEVQALKGFVTFYNTKRIAVKLPPESLSALTAKITGMGLVIDKSINREDLTLRIAELEGRLKSKREILGRTRAFLDDADSTATLDIESTMTQLVSEIENIRGELRVQYDRAEYAEVSVDFEFRERDKVLYVESPFEWLNTVDLGRFIEEF